MTIIDYRYFICLIGLNLVDAILTHFALKTGIQEGNPIINALMQWNYSAYLFVKIGIVSILIFVFYQIANTKRWIGIAFDAVLLMFCLLAAFHAYGLISQ
jgi:uncharacterized membrane protein YqjE